MAIEESELSFYITLFQQRPDVLFSNDFIGREQVSVKWIAA